LTTQRKARTVVEDGVRWAESEIVSLYGVSMVGRSLHEIRQVVFVDGKMVQGEQHAEQTLTELLTSSGDQQKLAALKQLQKYTLGPAATDFGPLLLLFAHGGAERYEFTPLGERQLGASFANTYHFKQLDGSEGLTLFAGQTQQLRIEGEIWVSEIPSGSIRIMLATSVPESSPLIREEATVDYDRSPLGALLPVQIEQLEYRGKDLVSENIFHYSDFQKLNGR